MPDFQGSVLGALLTLLGWDGTDFRNVKVDSSGHLQVDVLSNVLGGDQATETTLALVKDRIGDLGMPAAGSTNKLLSSSLTSLQLIDDLRGALHDVGDDELRVLAGFYDGDWFGLNQNAGGDLIVDVQETILPPGAATEASVQGIEDALPDQLVGYSDVYRQTVTDADAAAGSNTLDGTAVPASTLYVVTALSMYNATSTYTLAQLGVLSGGTFYPMHMAAGAAVNVGVMWRGRMILKEGEKIRAFFGGVTLNDNIHVHILGWKATDA